jgi:hypothetical protein
MFSLTNFGLSNVPRNLSICSRFSNLSNYWFSKYPGISFFFIFSNNQVLFIDSLYSLFGLCFINFCPTSYYVSSLDNFGFGLFLFSRKLRCMIKLSDRFFFLMEVHIGINFPLSMPLVWSYRFW